MVAKALEAAELLAASRASRRGVVNMSTIKPLDRALVERAGREAKLVVTAEEHSIIGGLGSAVAEVLAGGRLCPAAAPRRARRVRPVRPGGRAAGCYYGLTGPKVAEQIAARLGQAWANREMIRDESTGEYRALQDGGAGLAHAHGGPDDLLVQVKACAICGSDIKGYRGKTGRRQPPIIMGHEAAGVVTAIGEHVTGYQARRPRHL